MDEKRQYIPLDGAPEELRSDIIVKLDDMHKYDEILRKNYHLLLSDPKDHLDTDSCIESAYLNRYSRYTPESREISSACSKRMEFGHLCVRLIKVRPSDEVAIALYPIPTVVTGGDWEVLTHWNPQKSL